MSSTFYCDMIQLCCAILMRPTVNEVYRLARLAKSSSGWRVTVVEERSFDLLQKTCVRPDSVTCSHSICDILL